MRRITDGVSRFMKRWERRRAFSKRQMFVVVTGILTLGLVLTQLVSVEFRYPLVVVLALAAYLLSALSLHEDLRGIEWLTLVSLPTLYTAAISLFYFLLPVRWLTRLPVAGLYALGMYTLLLTENIYNVAAERTIALLRAAHSVGFLMTIVTFFLLVQTVLAFRMPVLFNVVLVGLLGFVLILQSLWSVELTDRVSSRVWRLSVVLSLVLSQLAWVFSFWPVPTTLKALFFTTMLYGAVGMGQQYLVEKLYKKTVIEFISVVTIVFFVVILGTNWRGQI